MNFKSNSTKLTCKIKFVATLTLSIVDVGLPKVAVKNI